MAATRDNYAEEDKYQQEMQEDAENQEPSLEEYIEILSAHQKKCEEEGKYVEAEMAMNRVKELKEQLKNRDSEDLQLQHESDLAELEETHIQEFNAFNQEWDKIMNQFQIHASEMIRGLEEKHDQQLQEERDKFEEKLGDRFKKSPELLSLISTQKNLARQKEYREAHKIQIEAQELEQKERERYYEDRQKRIEMHEAKIIQSQEREMESLRKKIIAGENEQKKERALKLERMFQQGQQRKDKNSLKRGQANFNPNLSQMSRASGRSQASSIGNVNRSAQKKRPSNTSSRKVI
ncbi:unnamed protein product [Moneuplotes crassus]|uniref:Uncharacterized protein n=1 Tax=Euplotes crassus TaxID=5936 RepID=A0AAD1XQ38_EUPCR|nr:unnamed protein product [Moneuplotes crassus]